MKVNVIQDYDGLTGQLNQARAELKTAEEKITANQDTLDLFSDKPVTILNCKNVFNKVKVGATTEDIQFTVNCECFDENEDCCHRKCDHHADNLNYLDARGRFLRAKDRLSAFKQSGKSENVR